MTALRDTGLGAGRKLGMVARVSIRRLLRDGQGVFFVLVFPMVLVLVLGVVFGGGFEPAVGISAPDDDPLAAEIVAGLDDNDELDVHLYDDVDSLRDAVEHNRVQAGVVIPVDYSRRVQSGDEVSVTFMAGPTGIGRVVQPVVRAEVDQQATRLQAARFATDRGVGSFDTALRRATELQGDLPKVTVEASTVGEELLELDQFGQFGFAASQQILLFTFITGLASSVALIQDRHLGVAQRMLSTPTSSRVVLLGLALGRFTVVMFQAVYIMLGTWLVFGVDWGDPLAALVLLVAFSLVATGAAMLVGALFRNEEQAIGVGLVLGLGMAALGGSMAPLEVFPPTMRTLAKVTPHAWGNQAFEDLIAGHGGLFDIAGEVAVLAAMAAAVVTVATWRLRRVLTAG